MVRPAAGKTAAAASRLLHGQSSLPLLLPLPSSSASATSSSSVCASSTSSSSACASSMPPSRQPPSPLYLLLLAAAVTMVSLPACCQSAVWQDPLPPKQRINSIPSDRVARFRSPDANDRFRLLDIDDDHLLIGAKNTVYNVSAATLSVRRRLEWRPSESDVKMCRLKGKSEQACHNYIRVIAKKAHDRLLVCGTNAYKPKCRDYVFRPSAVLPPRSPQGVLHNRDSSQQQQQLPVEDFGLLDERPGEGLCPYDPNHNSTFIFAAPLGYRTDGDLYVGTVGQFSGADPLIYRKPLRTEQFDLRHLNAPQFVSSMHLNGFVYFFFRESAVEYINCGKAIYSRVARVCTNDQGGPHKFKERFTSFLKARLNCSIPGEMPFYFNELQSTSRVVEGAYRGERARLIYSVLTTGPNSISGSAVCAFRLDDIDAAFRGAFKGQEDKNSNWLPVINSKIPEPRPGQCVNSSRSLPDVTLNFITNHPLMDHAVPAYFGRPVVVHAGFGYRYTYIAVDPQVEAVSGRLYDVLFVGTDHGHVLKVVNVASSLSDPSDHAASSSIIVEDVHVFGRPGGEGDPSTASPATSPSSSSAPVAVSSVIVQRSPYEQKLLVVGHNEVQGIPLFHCQRAHNCADCVHLQDPYCAWSTEERKCTHNWRRNRHASVQSVEYGWDDRCGVNSRSHPNSGAIVGDTRATLSAAAAAAAAAAGVAGVDGSVRSGATTNDASVGLRPAEGPTLTPTHAYTAETFAIAVTTSIVTSLVIGFISGYIFARRCKTDMDIDSPPEDYTRYVDIQRMNGLLAPDLGISTYGHEMGYGPGGGPRPINLVLNKNGKPTNHLGSGVLPNNASVLHHIQQLQMNNLSIHQQQQQQQHSQLQQQQQQQTALDNKTTLQRVGKIYL